MNLSSILHKKVIGKHYFLYDPCDITIYYYLAMIFKYL